MQFMAPVVVTCDRCQGRRFRPEVLAVRHLGRDIAETLELTVEAALAVFARERTLCRKLAPLAEVGLGYLRLGPADLDAVGRRGAAAEAGELPRPPGARGAAPLPVRRADHRPPPLRHRPALRHAAQAGPARRRRGRGRAQPRPARPRRLDRRPRAGRRRARRPAALLRPAGDLSRRGREPDRRAVCAAPCAGSGGQGGSGRIRAVRSQVRKASKRAS